MNPEQPVATPAVATARNPLATPSLVFGIVSLVTFWIPLVGIIFGVVGVVVSAKARKKSRQLNQQPPQSFIANTVLASIGIALGALFTLILFAALGPIFSGIGSQTGYGSYVRTLEQAPKQFTVNDTVAFGPYDALVRSDTTFQPTDAQITDLELAQRPYYLHGDQKKTIPAENRTYTKVALAVNYNQARAQTYNNLYTAVGGWGDAIEDATLNGFSCIQDLPKVDKDTIRDLNNPAIAQQNDIFPVTFGYICVSDKTTPEQHLELSISLFTQVSFIVGTEGMPTKQYTYLITL